MNAFDKLLKKKEQIEKKFQKFGADSASAYAHCAAKVTSPEATLKARQSAWYEGGKGNFPTK